VFIFYLASVYKRLLLLGALLLFAVFLFRNPLHHTFFQEKTEPDVYFWGINMGKHTREEVEEIVAARIGEWQVNPVDACYDLEQHELIPEVWGYRANVEKTVEEILNASSGQQVMPFLETVLPEVTQKDYPSAVIRKGNPVKDNVAFMVNVAWGTECILPLMDTMKQYEAKASFFPVGSWARKNRELIQEMAERGHMIGNHAHTDSAVITEMSIEELKDGLSQTNAFLEEVINRPVQFFTPHKGEYNYHSLEAISRLGMRTVLWSVDTIDWMEPGVEAMESRVLEQVHSGAIILMHPTKDTITLLQNILPQLRKQGLTVVTIEELFNPDHPPETFSIPGS